MTPSLFGEIEVNIMMLKALSEELNKKLVPVFVDALTDGSDEFDFRQLFPDLYLGEPSGSFPGKRTNS